MNDPPSECKDDKDCDELCFRFLNILSNNVKKESSSWLHKLCFADAGQEDAKEHCTDVIIKIEGEVGPEHIVCELALKIMAKRWLKNGMPDCALDLIDKFIDRKKSKDVDSLLLLSHIYINSGNCDSAVECMEKAYDLAEQSGEPLLLCLVLAKEACNLWYSKIPCENDENLKMCETILEEVYEAEKNSAYPLEKNAERLIEVFKTLGYFYGFLHKHTRKGAHYYRRALEILRKDAKSVLRILQVETRLIRMYSKHSRHKARDLCLNVFQEIKAVARDETFMTHHSLLVNHFLQDFAYSLENADWVNEALQLHEFAFEIGKEFSGESHPTVVRQAANIAYFCFRHKRTEKEEFYINAAKAALECSAVRESHAQELSDAWFTLGLLFSLKEDFVEAEKCYKEAISLTVEAYGPRHARLYRLYEKMAELYRMNEKLDLALNCYNTCKEIRDESSFDKTRTESPEFKISEILDLQGKCTPLTEIYDELCENC